MDVKKDILWRVYLCFLGMVVLGLMVLGKVVYIQNVQGAFWKEMGDSLHLRYQPVAAERGSIFSEDGNMLSTSVPIFDVYVDFAADGLRAKQGKRFKENLDSLSLRLSQLFSDKTPQEYKKELKSAYQNKLRYYALKKKISFDEYRELRDFPLVRLGKNKSGFIIETRDKRINPYVLMANRTIGLSRLDSNKNVGLEKTFNYLLTGLSGQKLMRYSAGAYIPVEGAQLDPVNGKDIITTLDTYIQDVAENALMKMLVENNSLHGTAIVMETATGKIKAIANLGRQTDGSYIEDLNYGIGKATEPGSVFKLATLYCLLKDKYITIDSKVNCENGAKKFHGLTIRDSHKGTGIVSVKEAFTESSNVAFASLAYQYYQNQPEKFVQHLSDLKLDTLTGIEIIASSGKPLIKKARGRGWSKTTIPYMAHGYEELVTPLNMLMFYNAVANNGKMMKPYLVNSIKEFGLDKQVFEPVTVVESIADADVIQQLKECLRAVVDSPHGTGRRILKDSVYSISGKTGTAVTAQDNRGYNKGNKVYQASFVGFFPSEAPKYSMAVVIQNTRESKFIYGADVSGRVFKDIADHIFKRYLNVPKTIPPGVIDTFNFSSAGMKNDLASICSYLNISYKDGGQSDPWRRVDIKNNISGVMLDEKLSTPKNITPDVKGLGLKDAVYLLENKGFKVSFTGKGKVATQSYMAGTNFTKGQNILLMLN